MTNIYNLNEKNELDSIDRNLAGKDIPLHHRPFYATIQIGKLNKNTNMDSKDDLYCKSNDDIISQYYSHENYTKVKEWYCNLYGDIFYSKKINKIIASTLIRNTPYLFSIPVTHSKVIKPGEISRCSFPKVVHPDEKVLNWIQNGPKFNNFLREDIIKAKKLTENIATKMRYINISSLEIDSSQPQIRELASSILPYLENAANLLIDASSNVYWELQMACELALKCLAQQELGKFEKKHDLSFLYDSLSNNDKTPPFSQKLLAQLLPGKEVVESRYNIVNISPKKLFCAYYAAINIIQSTMKSLNKKLCLENISFDIKSIDKILQ